MHAQRADRGEVMAMTTMDARRRAFTMLELLLTMTVIVILIGMTMSIASILQKQRKKVETVKLMRDIGTVLSDYITTYPLLGDVADATSSDFVDSPWTFLGRRRLDAEKMPYLDLLPKYLATGPAGGPWGNATQRDGDQILDAYRISDRSNHLVWAIVNRQSGNAGAFRFTEMIWMRSTVGTPDNPRDDIIMRFTLSNGQWQTLPYAEAKADPLLPVAFGL
jgi:type II secretory pathway pseudopilin PulG